MYAYFHESFNSPLGPLFFFLFINDLAFLMEDVKLTCKMFPDDTSLYDTGNDLKNLTTVSEYVPGNKLAKILLFDCKLK